MKSYLIKTHRLGSTYKKPHFFILNKGLNSGKPLIDPCPNCFVCIIENQEDQYFLYWLFFGLWKSKSFHYYLRGSVIPFITIADCRKHLNSSILMANRNLQAFETTISLMKVLGENELKMKATLETIDNTRQAIFQKLMKT